MKKEIILFFCLTLLIVFGLFYWLEWRPTQIKQACSWIHIQNTGTSEIPGDPSIIVPILPRESNSNTWDELNAYAQSNIEAENLQRLHDGQPAVPAQDYWTSATSEEYALCLREHGLASNQSTIWTSQEITTIALSIWGAVVATAGAVLSLILFFKDRAIIRVRAYRGFLMSEIEHSKNVITVSVANHGRRTISIEQLFFNLSNGKKLIFFNHSLIYITKPEFPILLGENGSVSLTLDYDGLVSEIKRNKVKAKNISICDNLGNIYSYKLKKKDWGEIRNDG